MQELLNTTSSNDHETNDYTIGVSVKHLLKEESFLRGPLSNTRTTTEELCFL
jgi:hypothetical protein